MVETVCSLEEERLEGVFRVVSPGSSLSSGTWHAWVSPHDPIDMRRMYLLLAVLSCQCAHVVALDGYAILIFAWDEDIDRKSLPL